MEVQLLELDAFDVLPLLTQLLLQLLLSELVLCELLLRILLELLDELLLLEVTVDEANGGLPVLIFIVEPLMYKLLEAV
jgi:hypothetical protein